MYYHLLILPQLHLDRFQVERWLVEIEQYQIDSFGTFVSLDTLDVGQKSVMYGF